MAHRRPNTVGTGVTTSNDDDVLAFGTDVIIVVVLGVE